MYQRTVLANQLRVLTAAMPHSTSVSITVSVGAGSRYEAAELAGLSHFLEHLPFKGTAHWPTAREVSAAIEGVGGVMNASTDREITVFWCKVARLHFRQGLAVLLDLLLNPLLEPEEMEREREVIQEELRMTYDYPSDRVGLLIDEILWPEQAMGRDVGGTPESVNNITLADVQAYMERQYNPANTVIAVAGNVEHNEIVELIDQATADWRPMAGLDWEPATELNGGGPLARVERKRCDQAHLCLGLPGVSLTDPDRYPFLLLNGILGDGMSSRLFVNLRENQGLAYDVASSLSHFRDCGSLVVYCGVEPKKTREAVQAVVAELEGMRCPAPAEELSKAKEFAKGRLLLRMEDTRSVAAWLGAQELLLGEVATVEDTVAKIDAVTADDITRTAERLIDPERLRLAVVGPGGGEKSLQRLLKF